MGWITGMTNEELLVKRQYRIDEIKEIDAELTMREKKKNDVKKCVLN
jgi:hypothetical protein